jgi:hypothetical protein
MMGDQRTGSERIADERRRQVEKEGWTPGHDDHHTDGDLVLAAVCYAAHAIGHRLFEKDDNDTYVRFYDPWPWNYEDDKRPMAIGGGEDGLRARLRLLEKAGALIAAEIDRLLRAAKKRSP